MFMYFQSFFLGSGVAMEREGGRGYMWWCSGAESQDMESLLDMLYIKAISAAHETFLLNRSCWSGAELL